MNQELTYIQITIEDSDGKQSIKRYVFATEELADYFISMLQLNTKQAPPKIKTNYFIDTIQEVKKDVVMKTKQAVDVLIQMYEYITTVSSEIEMHRLKIAMQ